MKSPLPVSDKSIRGALNAARSGRALGLAGEIDSKITPRGALAGGLSQIRLKVGATDLDQDGQAADACVFDLLAPGLFKPFKAELASGIVSPDVAAYMRAVHYFASNPAKLRRIMVQGSDAQAIADAEIASVRVTPFGTVESERVALASQVGPTSQNKEIVIIDASAELDGASFLRLFTPTYGAGDKFLTLTLFVEAVAEARRAL